MTEKKQNNKYENAFGSGWEIGWDAASIDFGPVRSFQKGLDLEKLFWEYGYINGYISKARRIEQKLIMAIMAEIRKMPEEDQVFLKKIVKEIEDNG